MRAWLTCLSLVLAASFPTSAAPLHALVVTGQNNHDWQQTNPKLEETLAQSGRFVFDTILDPNLMTREKLAGYDLVISNWTNWPDQERVWNAEAETALLAFVRSGKGFALFHAAAACFTKWTEFQQMIGGTWDLGQTGHGQIHTFTVDIADKQHPIARGLESITIRDELWHKVPLQPTAHVLCTAFSSVESGGTGQAEPVALVSDFGKGRCFNLILGHDAVTLSDYDWRLLFLRGAEWAATGKVTLTAPADVGTALDAAATYRRSMSRAPLAAVEELVQHAAGDRVRSANLARELAARLRGGATPDAKVFLLQQLSLIGSSAEVEAIASLADDERLSVHALFALERIRGEAAAAALRDIASKPSGSARVGAIDALGAKRDVRAQGLLIQCLASEDVAVAQGTIGALGKIAGARAIEALLPILDDGSSPHRAAAAAALLSCAEAEWAAGRPKFAGPLFARLSIPSQPAAIRETAWVGRMACAGDRRGELVVGGLRGEDPVIRAAAVRTIREIGGHRVAQAASLALPDLALGVQVRAIAALADLGEAEAAAGVSQCLPSKDGPVRLAALDALRRLAHPDAWSPLRAFVRTQATDVERRAAESALAAMCRVVVEAPGALPLSEEDVRSEDTDARGSLLRVLALVGTDRALVVVRAFLSDPSPDTRCAAISALAEWPNASVAPELLSIARTTEDAAERTTALVAIAGLARRLLGTPEGVIALIGDALALADGAGEKRALLGALALVRIPGALPLVRPLLDDAFVRADACAAAVAIAETLPADALPQIQPVLERVLEVATDLPELRIRAKTVLLKLGVPVEVTRSVDLGDPGPNLAKGATATSPDNLDKDGDASGDQAAIDGDPATYWDEVNDQPVYRLRVTFPGPTKVSALRILGHAPHSYVPKDFEVICDGKTVLTVKDAWYTDNRFAVTFPTTECSYLELKITGYYGQSPAIRELEIFGPAK